MRKMEKLTIEYTGYKQPATKDEIEFEILGLELAQAAAQQRIQILKQSLKLSEMALKND